MIEEWIKDEDTDLELLPFCHTTRWKSFEKILKQGALAKKHSRFPNPEIKDVKGKEVIYLYYGLPFYIYETGDGENVNIEATDDLPIGLIFKPESVHRHDACYPFDSGALFSDKYKHLLSCSFNELEINYKLTLIDGERIKKLTKRYYSENENYCNGLVCFNNVHKCPKEENLLRLLNHSANSPIDLRMRAFEIHSLDDLSLEDNLLAIILPKRRANKYKEILDNISHKYPLVKIVKYRDFQKGSHLDFRAVMMNTVMDFYEKDYPEFLS